MVQALSEALAGTDEIDNPQKIFRGFAILAKDMCEKVEAIKAKAGRLYTAYVVEAGDDVTGGAQ